MDPLALVSNATRASARLALPALLCPPCFACLALSAAVVRATLPPRPRRASERIGSTGCVVRLTAESASQMHAVRYRTSDCATPAPQTTNTLSLSSSSPRFISVLLYRIESCGPYRGGSSMKRRSRVTTRRTEHEEGQGGNGWRTRTRTGREIVVE